MSIEAELRKYALSLAQTPAMGRQEPTTETVKRAEMYLAFLKGQAPAETKKAAKSK